MSAAAIRPPNVALTIAGGVLVAGAFIAPSLYPVEDPDDFITRVLARVAVLYWGLGSGSLLLRCRELARSAWTVGCVVFLVHVGIAFDRVHHWSHAAAARHVESVSGFGPGLFVSYAFTLTWLVDVAWWWADCRGHDRRSRWLDWLIHGFMAFVVFNATVVFEIGMIRWAGLILFSALGLLLANRRAPPTLWP